MDTVSDNHHNHHTTAQFTYTPPNQRNACATYNLLAEEGRQVAAALLPSTQQPWK